MWTNNRYVQFNCKADAFKWLNDTELDTDYLKLYCDGELRYIKTMFGIFDNHTHNYIKGNLPVEYYH